MNAGLVSDDDHGDVRMESIKGRGCASSVRERVARVEHDHVETESRNGFDDLGGAAQSFDLEPMPREQEPSHAPEARIASCHEHTEWSKRTNILDVHPGLFHGLPTGPWTAAAPTALAER
jgi:hypothetical protein